MSHNYRLLSADLAWKPRGNSPHKRSLHSSVSIGAPCLCSLVASPLFMPKRLGKVSQKRGQ